MRDLLTVEQAAKALGVSKMTIYRRIDANVFTAVYDFKNQMYIPKSEVEAILSYLREKGFTDGTD